MVFKNPNFAVGSSILTHLSLFIFFYNNLNSLGGKWVPLVKRGWDFQMDMEIQKRDVY